jgi:hypothetical protein
MPKPLRVAGEVDGWCTRCRLVLNHRIVSMKGGKAHQVECLTCRTTHLWRAGAPGTGTRAESSGAASARPSAAPRATRANAAARHAHDWEHAVSGRGVREFKDYSVAGIFQQGDLLRHKKFGDGVVTRVIDARKVEVLFRDDVRTLAQGSP